MSIFVRCPDCALCGNLTKRSNSQCNQTPVGQYGRCGTCGGRTYDGWCPRAFCPTTKEAA